MRDVLQGQCTTLEKVNLIMAGDLCRSRRWERASAQQKDEIRVYIKQMHIGAQSLNWWKVVKALSISQCLFDCSLQFVGEVLHGSSIVGGWQTSIMSTINAPG